MVSLKERIQNYKRAYDIAVLKKQTAKVEARNRTEKPFKTIDPILICGQPRGGTTWLAETMSTPATGIIWEPLHPAVMEKYDFSRNIGQQLGLFPFIPEDVENEELQHFFHEVLTAKFLPYDYIAWPRSVNRNILEKNQWILKFCRANRILPWMVQHLDIKPPIYLLRHPCAVVSSQLRHEAFDQMGDSYISENGSYPEHFRKYEHILKKVNSRIGKLAAWWAMDNVIPLQHPENDKSWITVSYEELVAYPEKAFSRIYECLDLPLPDNLMENLKKPSTTTKPGAMVLKGGNQLEGWTKKLSKREIHEILDIVHAFGIDVYSDDLEPDYSKLSPLS